MFLQPSSRRKAPGLEQGLMRPLKNSYYWKKNIWVTKILYTPWALHVSPMRTSYTKKILNDNGPKLLFGQRIVRRRSTSNLFFFPNLLSSSFELLLFTQKKSRLFIITNFDFIYCLNYRTASLIMKIGLFFGSFYLQLNSIRLKILYLPSSNINETFYVDFKSF